MNREQSALLDKIISLILNERGDIPSPFAVDGDLAKQADKAVENGDLELAEHLWRAALEKEYGKPKK
jgi:hypothetical protein